ncbi:MAG: hypothetical protein K6U89_04130 [Chloroflexi bacterium]|nr:hypothetical protein [Chloroflexota bacterium]
MRRELLCWPALVLLPVLVATGCLTTTAVPSPPERTGGTPRYPPPLAPNQPVTIRFESYLLAVAGPNRNAQLRLLEEFSRRFPAITVETKATPAGEIAASLRTQVAAGNPPDLAQAVLGDWDRVVESLGPVPLD